MSQPAEHGFGTHELLNRTVRRWRRVPTAVARWLPLRAVVDLSSRQEQSAIHQVHGRWRPKQPAEIHVPHSIRSVVRQRVERLSPEAQDLLNVASVMGQVFDLDLLEMSVAQPEAQVLDQLDAAFSARLIEERREERVDRYAFVHSLIQQTLYQQLSAYRRNRLHRRVGEALEQLRGDRPEALAELARHFGAARDSRRATEYSVLAGDHASALFAHVEAAAQYQTALNLLKRSGEQLREAEVSRKLGRELSDANRVHDAIVAYSVALATYKRLGDTATEAHVHREMGWVHQAQDDFRAAEPQPRSSAQAVAGAR